MQLKVTPADWNKGKIEFKGLKTKELLKKKTQENL
jgi:hypothetical protein